MCPDQHKKSPVRIINLNRPFLLGWIIFTLFFITLTVDVNMISKAQSEGLDLVFAIDTTGSMFSNVERNEFSRFETGLRLHNDNGALPFTATDRNEISYRLTRFTLEWLAGFARTNPNLFDLDMRVTVISFDSEPRILLENFNLLTDPITQLADITPPSLPETQRSADYLNLYSEINRVLGNARPERQRSIFMITDSVPCNPAGPDQQSGQFVRDAFCQQTSRMQSHLRLAIGNVARDVVQNVYHISPDAFWVNNLSPVSQTWESAIDSTNGQFTQLTSINDLPTQLFRDLLALVTNALRGGQQRDVSSIGIIENRSNSFTVEPYQAQMEVILLLEEGQTAPTFLGPDGTAVDNFRSQSIDNRFLRLTFDRPRGGQWQTPGFTSTWVSFTPATPSLTLENAELNTTGTAWSARQYQAVQVVYEMRGDGFSIVDPENMPIFELTVRAPDGTEYTNLTMTPAGVDFRSQPFLLLQNGNYTFNFSARPSWESATTLVLDTPEPEATAEPDSEIGTGGIRLNYLSPAPLAPLRVEPINFTVVMGDENQQAQLADSSRIEMRRSQVVPIRAFAYLGQDTDRTPITLPQGIDAILNFTGETCADTISRPMITQGNALTVIGGLNFDAGECEVAINISLSSDEHPLLGNQRTLLNSTLGTVRSIRTARLSVDILMPNGEVVAQDFDRNEIINQDQSSLIHFSMIDRQTVPTFDVESSEIVRWTPNQINIDIVFRDTDQSNIPTDPVFVGMTRTSTSTTTEADNQFIEDYPIPFTLTVVRLGDTENLALSNEAIQLRKSAREGFYVVSLSDLQPGDYELRLELLQENDGFALREEYEYMIGARVDDVVNPRYIAYLRVAPNPLIPIQIGVVGAVASTIILLISGVIIAWRRRTVAPLSGTLTILHDTPDGKREVIWQMPLPAEQGKHVNEYKYAPRVLTNTETIRIPLTGLSATTRRNKADAKAGKATVIVQIGEQKQTINLRPNERVSLDAKPNYAIVKDYRSDGA